MLTFLASLRVRKRCVLRSDYRSPRTIIHMQATHPHQQCSSRAIPPPGQVTLLCDHSIFFPLSYFYIPTPPYPFSPLSSLSFSPPSQPVISKVTTTAPGTVPPPKIHHDTSFSFPPSSYRREGQEQTVYETRVV